MNICGPLRVAISRDGAATATFMRVLRAATMRRPAAVVDGWYRRWWVVSGGEVGWWDGGVIGRFTPDETTCDRRVALYIPVDGTNAIEGTARAARRKLRNCIVAVQAGVGGAGVWNTSLGENFTCEINPLIYPGPINGHEESERCYLEIGNRIWKSKDYPVAYLNRKSERIAPKFVIKSNRLFI